VWGQEKKNTFLSSPINSKKRGEKKGKLFYPRRYIATSGEILAEPAGVIGVDFF